MSPPSEPAGRSNAETCRCALIIIGDRPAAAGRLSTTVHRELLRGAVPCRRADDHLFTAPRRGHAVGVEPTFPTIHVNAHRASMTADAHARRAAR